MKAWKASSDSRWVYVRSISFLETYFPDCIVTECEIPCYHLSSEEEEADEDDHFEEYEEEIVINDASDHEFSPESDIDDDDDYKPVKRARTAHSSEYFSPIFEVLPKKKLIFCQYKISSLVWRILLKRVNFGFQLLESSFHRRSIFTLFLCFILHV